MRRWIKVDKVDGQYAVLTGYDESASTTFMVSTLNEVFSIMQHFFGAVPPIDISVAEGLNLEEQLR